MTSEHNGFHGGGHSLRHPRCPFPTCGTTDGLEIRPDNDRRSVSAEATLDLGQCADTLESDDYQELARREGADLRVAVLYRDVPTGALVINLVALVAEGVVDDIVGDLNRGIEREPRLAEREQAANLR